MFVENLGVQLAEFRHGRQHMGLVVDIHEGGFQLGNSRFKHARELRLVNFSANGPQPKYLFVDVFSLVQHVIVVGLGYRGMG